MSAKVTVWDRYDLEEGRVPPSAVTIQRDDAGDLVLEVEVDDAIYLSPEGARMLAIGLAAMAEEMEAG